MKYLSTIFEKVILFSLHKSKGGLEYFIGVQNKEIQFDWFFYMSQKFFLTNTTNHQSYLIINIPKFGNFWDVTM